MPDDWLPSRMPALWHRVGVSYSDCVELVIQQNNPHCGDKGHADTIRTSATLVTNALNTRPKSLD